MTPENNLPLNPEKGNFEQGLIQALKEKGAADPEVKNLLNDWTCEQEKQVEQSGDYRAGQIQLNLRRARLYFEAGYTAEALENFEAAQTQAWHERRDELYRVITEEIDKLTR